METEHAIPSLKRRIVKCLFLGLFLSALLPDSPVPREIHLLLTQEAGMAPGGAEEILSLILTWGAYSALFALIDRWAWRRRMKQYMAAAGASRGSRSQRVFVNAGVFVFVALLGFSFMDSSICRERLKLNWTASAAFYHALGVELPQNWWWEEYDEAATLFLLEHQPAALGVRQHRIVLPDGTAATIPVAESTSLVDVITSSMPMQKKLACVRALLERGDDPNLPVVVGGVLLDTPLDAAFQMEGDWQEIMPLVDLLVSHGADPFAWTPSFRCHGAQLISDDGTPGVGTPLGRLAARALSSDQKQYRLGELLLAHPEWAEKLGAEPPIEN